MVSIPPGWNVLVHRDGQIEGYDPKGPDDQKPDLHAKSIRWMFAGGRWLVEELEEASKLPDAIEALEELSQGEDCSYKDHPRGETKDGTLVCLSDDCVLATCDRLLVEDYETANPVAKEADAGVPK
jgi:hypothetical protein